MTTCIAVGLAALSQSELDYFTYSRFIHDQNMMGLVQSAPEHEQF